MGGRNSTRWRDHQRKPLVESALAIDLLDPAWKAALGRPWVAGNCEWSRADSGAFLQRLDFRLSPIQDDGTRFLVIPFSDDLDGPGERVVLEPIQAGFSTRWLGRCPRACGRRARRLFWLPGRLELGCVSCSGLAYRSAQRHDRRIDELIDICVNNAIL
ncbi:MAG: hypothetical protein ACYTFI_27210 [Planctomycetota bacterium]|jgi:hypothetical protein